jgi:hypothetical protein
MISNGKSLINTTIIVLSASLIIGIIVFDRASQEASRQIDYTNEAGHHDVKLRGAKERALGLSYEQVIASIDSQFIMNKGQSANGRDYYSGKCGNVFLNIASASGNINDVLQVSIIFYGIKNDTGTFDPDGLAIVGKFLNNIFPNWTDVDKDIANQIEVLRLKPNIGTSIIRDNKRIDLKYQIAPNMIVGGLIIVIEPL